MNTLEKTISMIETLPEADLMKVQDLVRTIFQQRECETADETVGKMLRTMSERDFLNDVQDAEKEIADGNYKGTEEVFKGFEQRYGF